MGHAKSTGSRRPPSVGDQRHVLSHTTLSDGYRGIQHFPHAWATARPLSPNDDDVAGAELSLRDTLARLGISFEYACSPLKGKIGDFSGFYDTTVGGQIPLQNNDAAVRLERVLTGTNNGSVGKRDIDECFRQRAPIVGWCIRMETASIA